MKYFRGVMVVAALLSVAVFTGCEIDATSNSSSQDNGSNPLLGDSSNTDTSSNTNTNTPPDTTKPPTDGTDTNTQSSLDDLDISHAQDYGPHASKSAKKATITRRLHSASIRGSNVVLSFDDLNWPTKSGEKTIDGGVYIYWVEGGKVVGGLFDWHAKGQTTKTLGNINGGYLSGHKPPSGATVYFVLVSLDVRQRTNVRRCSTKW